MEPKKTIFIIGITGNQGSAVAKHLLAQNHKVIGLTRNTNSEKAKHWQNQGVTLIEGDLNKPNTYKSHLEKADAIYLVQALQGKQKEITQGKRFIDALGDLNKAHLVYASVLGADLNTGVPHFDSKFELENYIKSKNLDYTILRPASFYENHLFPRVAKDIRKGTYMSPLNKTCKQQMIGVDAIGRIASKVISNRENYKGKTLSIATDEWQTSDIPNVFSDVINKPVAYKKLPGFISRIVMGKDLYKMFKYMNTHDFCVVEDLDAVKNEFNIKENFKSWTSKNFKTE